MVTRVFTRPKLLDLLCGDRLEWDALIHRQSVYNLRLETYGMVSVTGFDRRQFQLHWQSVRRTDTLIQKHQDHRLVACPLG